MALLTVLFVWLGGMIGGRQGAVIAFAIAAAMNLFTYWNSDKLVLRRYQAQEVGPQDNSRFYMIIHRLAQSARLPMPRVYIIPSSTPNAFATGRNPDNAAVAATQGLLQMLDDDEIEGVMAHELAHVKNRDILTGTIAATLVGAIAMLAQFGRFGMLRSRQRQNPIMLIAILIAAPLAAMLIRMAISRGNEYAADRGGAKISRKPGSLADALVKISRGVERVPMERGNPAHAHLFIINPFLGGGLQKLFSTHPPMEARVKRLREMAGGPM